MEKKFTSSFSQMLTYSKQEAQRLGNGQVTPSHFLLAMMKLTGEKVIAALDQLHVDFADLRTKLELDTHQNVVPFAVHNDEIILDSDASRIIRLSILEARFFKAEVIDVDHLLLAILRDGKSHVVTLLQEQGVTYEALRNILQGDNFVNETSHDVDDDDEDYDPVLSRSYPDKNKQTTTASRTSTPVLDNFGTDLTKAAQDGLLDPVVGRSQEIERVAQILSRRKKNNPILIGAPGVGKSAIVEGLALRIVEHKISPLLWDKRIVVLDMSSVVAGTKYRGQFEERIRAIIQELQKNPHIIIFIDEIHTIVGAGSAAGTMDAANMMKPALSRGEIQCIGATTIDEFRKSIEKDGALERRFQKVMVNATTPAETLQILHNLRDRYEEHHHVKFTDEALEACVKYTERYVTDRCFPDKAIDAMDEAGSRIHIVDMPENPEITFMEDEVKRITELKNNAVSEQNFELAADYRDQLRTLENALNFKRQEMEEQLNSNIPVVDAEHIASVVSMMTGIPVQKIGEEEHQRLRNLTSALKSVVVGQDEAVEKLSRAIQRSRVGLKDPNKPIGTFMFVGPTGVGKTYLCKKLAELMFGSSESLIRVDMSEYMEKHTVSRMVGAPPGYVGYEEGGQLTEKVRRRPYSIVLLDEIEKAHPDVFNVLLQVMDDGRLTDGNGSVIDFKNTIIIMTSNSGSRQLKEFGNGVGFSVGTDVIQDKKMARSLVQKSLQKQFSPEFMNRLDDIIYFDQLSQEAITSIVDIEIRPLASRIQEMGYGLELTDAAKQHIGKNGYDVQYGARPLKRALQNLVEDPICQLIMDDGIELGDTVLVDVVDDKLDLKIKK